MESLRKRVAELEAELNRAFIQIETLSNLLDKTAFVEETIVNQKMQREDGRGAAVISSLVEKIEDIRRKGEQNKSAENPSLSLNLQVGAPSKVKAND